MQILVHTLYISILTRNRKTNHLKVASSKTFWNCVVSESLSRPSSSAERPGKLRISLGTVQNKELKEIKSLVYLPKRVSAASWKHVTH